MSKRYLFYTLALFLASFTTAFSQSDDDSKGVNQGSLSGSLEANGNFFVKDSSIGAANTPQYERQFYSADAWLNLNYNNYGFDVGVRFDIFNNSYLLNPQGSYTAVGIGRWYLKKKINKLSIYGGYIYDQIGSGMIFRAYEERPLAIDNALYGLHLSYQIARDWKVKAFTGRQKQQFSTYESILKGAAIDGFFTPSDSSRWSIAPGFGVVNKTLSDNQMAQVINTLKTYHPNDSIGANYQTYAFSLYNTLTAGDFTWYVEGAYKTHEVFRDPKAEKTTLGGDISTDKFVNKSGTSIYTSVSYAHDNFGITLEGKRTENFTFRADPFATLNRGTINFLPPMTRVNTYRLKTRYLPATQELGEIAAQGDVRYKFSKAWSAGFNFSYIDDLKKTKLYREYDFEINYKHNRKWTLTAGLQMQEYNQDIYQEKPGVPMVKTITPYAEWLYKFNSSHSIRVEAQYMDTKQDYGSWLFVLAEYSIAPRWTFAVSDMYNTLPKKTSEGYHYPSVLAFFTYGPSRFSFGYVRQVEGIVCTGGICRLEPAFNGVKLTINTLF